MIPFVYRGGCCYSRTSWTLLASMSGMALDIDTDTAKQKASVRYICSRRSKLCSRQSESELYPKTDKALFSPIRERVISKDGQSSVLGNQRASYIQRQTALFSSIRERVISKDGQSCSRQSESELYHGYFTLIIYFCALTVRRLFFASCLTCFVVMFLTTDRQLN